MKFSSELAKLDCAVALERLGGDEELLREVARLFLEEYPQLVDEIRSAVETRNANALERAAHSMKGSVSNFATDGVFQAALRLEQIGRSGNISEATTHVDQLESALAYIHPALVELAEN